MTWNKVRLARDGRKGWDLTLPRFKDAEHPDDAERMNRFYDTAADGMEQAAGLAMQTEARRVRYRCETDVAVLFRDPDAAPDKPPKRKKETALRGRPGDIRVELKLSLSVSGQRTLEKTLVHLWRDGTLLSSRTLL